MTRWLVALAAALLIVLAGYLLLLNPDPVVVHVAPGRTVAPPLAGALLVAFALGGLLVGLAAAMRAGARGWRSWRDDRRVRREARRTAATTRARELLWAGDYAQARAALSRGVNDGPADSTRVELLAEAYLHEGDVPAARKLLDEALVRIGLEPRLLDLTAEAAERAGDLRGAADALERARVAQPASPRLARHLRDVYAAAGRWAEALTIQSDVLLRIREPALLRQEEHIMRGLRYQAALAEPDPGRGVRLLLALAREDPTFVPAWVGAGDLLVAGGRRFAARRTWERGARYRPDAVLLERIERLNASEGKPERTTRVYRRLQRRHPEARAIALLFARHLILQGAFEQASQVLSGVSAPLAGHPIAHALWGELHRRRGNHNLAADTFARGAGPELGLGAPFRCAFCRAPATTWAGYCTACRRWGTFRARAERAADAT